MTRAERVYIEAIIKYKRREIVYDKWAYSRMQNAYRVWLKKLLNGEIRGTST